MKSTAFAGGILLMLLAVSCGTETSSQTEPEGVVRVVGIVDVLHAGTRSETVILTNDATGEVFALVGELAYDIIPDYGMTTSVLGRFTDEGYSVREDLRKINVIDYAFIGPDEPDGY